MIRFLIFLLLLALALVAHGLIRRLLSASRDDVDTATLEGPQQELPSPQRDCVRCGLPFDEDAELYETFERMHRRCFHLEYEHDGAEDSPCADPGCPLRLEQRSR